MTLVPIGRVENEFGSPTMPERIAERESRIIIHQDDDLHTDQPSV